MIDTEHETLVTFAAAPAVLPAINDFPGATERKPVHQRTIYNWATRGKRGVILEAVPIGGILVTSVEALRRFFDRLAEDREQRLANQHGKANGYRPMQRCNPKTYAAIRARLAREHGI